MLTETTEHPSLDEECESSAFDSVVPEHVVPESALHRAFLRTTARPGDRGVLEIGEYVFQFRDAQAAGQSLAAYKDAVEQCIRQTPDERSVSSTVPGIILTDRPMQGMISASHATTQASTFWEAFGTVGSRAIWLHVTGGARTDIDRVAELAIRSASTA